MSSPVGRRARSIAGLASIALMLLLLVASAPPALGAGFPPLPIGDDRAFLFSLSGPSLTPGSTGRISFVVGDPSGFGTMSSIVVTLQVYAFNAFPGNATSSVAGDSPPILVTSTSSGASANLTLAPLSAGGTESGSVEVATSDATPAGTFAVRTALSFVENATDYRLESRGWFTTATWAAATELPNGSTTLNLSALGVSGVTAETSIYVANSTWDWALAFILAASLIFVGAGAFLYFRRTGKSSSGAR